MHRVISSHTQEGVRCQTSCLRSVFGSDFTVYASHNQQAWCDSLLLFSVLSNELVGNKACTSKHLNTRCVSHVELSDLC